MQKLQKSNAFRHHIVQLRGGDDLVLAKKLNQIADGIYNVEIHANDNGKKKDTTLKVFFLFSLLGKGSWGGVGGVGVRE